MYTTIDDYLKGKRKLNENANPVQSAAQPVQPTAQEPVEPETKIATSESKDVLGDLIKNMSVCHFIINKGLNESSTLESINSSIKDEFEVDNFFGSDDEFNTFYVKTMESAAAFLAEAGWFDKVKNAVTGSRVFNLETYQGTEAGKKELANPGRKQSVDKIKKGFTNMGLPQEFLDKAVMAIFDFNGGSAPIIHSYDFTWDAEKKTLKIDPNGGGLFNGKMFAFN